MAGKAIPFEKRFWEKVDKHGDDDCWLWTGSTYRHPYTKESTYGAISYNGTRTGAHRASWMFHNQADIPEGMVVMHICDNPKCVNPKHLKLGTMRENIKDRDLKGRGSAAYGERAPQARLTIEQVREIRRLKGKVTQKELAKRYGVSTFSIRSIYIGRTWSRFPD